MPEDGFILERAQVVIIGLGLMGGSLALSLRGRCGGLSAIDPDGATVQRARARRLVGRVESDPAGVLPGADLVILAAPVPAILDWLTRLGGLIDRPCIVMDLGSTKRRIARAMQQLPANFDPIGAHPICGRERLGLEHAAADLYTGAPFVVTPLERTTEAARTAAEQVIAAAGGRRLELTPERHDQVLSATSHLPFLVSSALALATPGEHADFLGTGFRSVSRLAGTPASMMLGVLDSNRDNILESLQRFRAALALIESALAGEDELELAQILHRSRSSYEALLGQAA
jgi:prephenate dehydrogenase